MAGIYIHIPFCKQACYYCDFHFSTNLSKKDEMVNAICKEIELQKAYLNEPLNSIYFGGGTPSLLSQKQLVKILQTVHDNFTVNPNAEITLEANPDDLHTESLAYFKAESVNRLSIGIQSFHDAHLKYMNRSHNAEEAATAVKKARNAGFEKLTIDLIFALPDSNHQLLKSDLEKALQLETEHISAYCLTIEPQTVFGKWKRNGKLTESDEEFAAEQFEILMNTLTKAGYEQYEISNFAKDQNYAVHNTAYWKQIPYLGVGPSAHSFNTVSRQFNISHNHKYLKALQEGSLIYEKEILSINQKINECIMTSLRTMWGYQNQKMLTAYNFDLLKEKRDTVKKMIQYGLVLQDGETLKLTTKGRLQADWIAGELFVEEIE
ncbi:radical SAM family heme chaperone HemW [Chondrinema litorale]|uniref:radical SAM family heme chaperone HemW n=1 Tax=Chondrinema litorale TaxID=2994555 RepID=UPI002544840C|nr:radical SAM family heme chaperone HemW [Chondrinema litorale]UZR95717.1 radical SAM family heme chaperone HemW [Chondrinema litorale]